MNSKNIVIGIGVLVIGLILYKFLLGFVLPIALFVSLRNVLKFLLKGSETDSDKKSSQILKNNQGPSSKDKIVEIEPIEEGKTSEVDEHVDEEKISE